MNKYNFDDEFKDPFSKLVERVNIQTLLTET